MINHKRYIKICYVIGFLFFGFWLMPGDSYAVASTKPATSTDLSTTNLWRTGVDALNNKIFYAGGSADQHYNLSDVTNDGGYKPCQPGAGSQLSPYFPASAIIVQEYNNDAGTSRSNSSHPWHGNTYAANWIGANSNGQDSSTDQCPNPSDFTRAKKLGLYPSYWRDPAWQDPRWITTWNTYHFSAISNFSVNVSSKVDTSTIKLNISGTSDNMLGVIVNGCSLKATNYPVDGQTDQYTSSYTTWADPGYQFSGQTTTFEVPYSCLHVNNGTTNQLSFLVKSGDDLTGLRITNLNISGYLLPSTEPYFTVHGGDVVAGIGFKTGSTCPLLSSSSYPGNQALIKSWNANGGGSYYGAGSQAGAFALGQISHFITGLNQSSLAYPYDVSFANLSNVGAAVNPYYGYYGGGFGGYGSCLDDYYGQYYNSASASSSSNVNLASITTSGVYSFKSNINLYGQLPKGINVTLVVNGSVYISAAIQFAPYAVDTVPSLSVVANYDIFVGGASSVNEIHGYFVAQHGIFASCSTGPGNETTDFDSCNHQLLIYGAVAANKIHFDRTFGSYDDTTTGPAEDIRFTPESWLGGFELCAPGSPNCLTSNTKYQSLAGLPPVL
ncbi:hypothetical protein H7171_01950 [Candidatus Saccharibacteria bacterium]|nr:hypothetical protein [Candidatus Saccharibacteria bacterium]